MGYLTNLRSYLAAYREDLRWAWPYNVERARFILLMPIWLPIFALIVAGAWTAHFISKVRSHG